MFKNPFRYFGYLIITLPCFASATSWDTKPICLSALKPDINNDGIVNYLDLWMVGRSYNLTSDDSRFIQKADTNCDNRIDAHDWDYVSQAKYKNYPIQKEVNHFKVSLVKEKDYFVGTNAFVESHIKLNSYSTDLDVYVSPVNIKSPKRLLLARG